MLKTTTRLTGNESTRQTQSVSLHETTINLIIRESKDPTETVELRFNSNHDICDAIHSLTKVLKMAMHAHDFVNEGLESFEVVNYLDLIHQLIPFGQLEAYQRVKEDLFHLNTLSK